MDRIRIISAIFQKQMKDLLKNMQVLILFFVYPLVALIMTTAMSGSDEFGSEIFFVSIFSAMHCIFTPIVSIVSIISEEKEKNTLRALIMSNVKSTDYLIGTGGFVFIFTVLSSFIFLFAADFTLGSMLKFIIAISIACVCSIVLGLSIGGFSKNMTSANAIAVPVGLIFSFLPMLSGFNEKIAEVSKFTYGYQVSNLISNEGYNIGFLDWSIILLNLVIFILMFILVFRRNKLED